MVTSMEAMIEFKHPFFQLERNIKHNGRIFTRYPVNASERETSIEVVRVFLNTMLKILTRVTKKTKRSWTYISGLAVFVSSLRLQYGR